jgi:RNA polymerase primary sigma factor
MIVNSSLLSPRETGREFYAHAAQARGEALLSAAEERTLAEAVASGDGQARDRLASANLGLVHTIARAYAGRGLEHDDLVGEGNLGLLRAVKDFDPDFGVRFSTYAAYWIKQSIRHALTNTMATIRLPAHMVKLLSKWRLAERELARELGGAPTFDLTAASLGLSEDQRSMVGRALRSRCLVHESFNDDGSVEHPLTGIDARPEAEVERRDEGRGLRARMEERLDRRERELITLRFGLDDGEPLTLREAGRRMGFTREWARKIEKRAVAKLRVDKLDLA